MTLTFCLLCLLPTDSCKFVPLSAEPLQHYEKRIMINEKTTDLWEQRRVRVYNEIFLNFSDTFQSFHRTSEDDSAILIHQYGPGYSISKSVVVYPSKRHVLVITYQQHGAELCHVPWKKAGINNQMVDKLFAINDNIPAPNPWPFYDRDPRTYTVDIRVPGKRRLYYVNIEGLSREHFNQPYQLKNTSEWYVVEQVLK
ncbi:MAG: hypothetical protein ACOYW3_03540 [Bacteroidota bacterium]